MAECDNCHKEFDILDKQAWSDGHDYINQRPRYLCPSCNDFHSRSMTAGEVITLLQEYDSEMPVLVGCRSHPDVIGQPVQRLVNIRKVTCRGSDGSLGPCVLMYEEPEYVEESSKHHDYSKEVRERTFEKLLPPFERWKERKK